MVKYETKNRKQSRKQANVHSAFWEKKMASTAAQIQTKLVYQNDIQKETQEILSRRHKKCNQ